MKKALGIFLCFAIALPAWHLGKIFPLTGGPVIAILAGIVISFVKPGIMTVQFGREFTFADGIKFTSGKLLKYSIILLGFQMNFFNILKVSGMSLVVLGLNFLTVFIVAFCAGKLLKLAGNSTVLIGVGTSICGGSAIAAIAPIIRAEDEDVSRAVSTIFLFNLIAVFIFPVLGRFMGLEDTVFGIWAGAAINDTSSVVAAGTIWSNAAENNSALTVAAIVKLTRTLMLIPVSLFLALYTAKKAINSRTDGFSFVKVFPWFVLFFIAAALLNTFLGIPAGTSSFLVQAGKFLIVMAMAAIGLNTNLKNLFSGGIKSLILGGLCWVSIIIVSLTALRFG